MKPQILIGRKNEQNRLLELYNSKQSEFVAIYGRRRIGKTFLVKELFQSKFTFVHTGMAKTGLADQLANFRNSLIVSGYADCPKLDCWLTAFHHLSKFIEQSRSRRKVIFIDELPWLDTPKSKFIPAFEHFWNGWAAFRNDILLIVCGSATSWVIDNVINSHGGLYNRITEQIYLRPFSLGECEEYTRNRGINLSRYDLLLAYMIFGGVPLYWSLLRKGLSLHQNIDNICFRRGGGLTTEFGNLYDSLFRSPQPYIDIVTALAKKPSGMTRYELVKSLGTKVNGHFSAWLNELEQCDFIRKYNCFGKKNKDALYQLTDCFTLFYFHFMNGISPVDDGYWTSVALSMPYKIWSGLAFERVCLLHIPQLKKALGISGVLVDVSSWRTDKQQAKENGGAQIDLVINRKDGIINICEMKFYADMFTIDQEEEQKLRHRIISFSKGTKTTKAIHLTMITTYGLKQNIHSGIVQNVVKMNDLFVNVD